MGAIRSGLPGAPSRRTVVLAAGDGAAIGAFVAGGELRHGGSLGAGIETFAVFLVAWFVVAVPLGAFGRTALEDRRRTAVVVGAGWLAVTALAQVGRLLLRPGSSIAPTFVLVSIVIGGGLLLGWRLVAVSALRGGARGGGGGGPPSHNGRT